MIQPKDLHERHFFESNQQPDIFFNFSDIPAMYVVKNNNGYIPYYWNPTNNQWEAGIIFTTASKLDEFINKHKQRFLSVISNIIRCCPLS